MILPGATLGVLGGGQLGRMFTIAARTMGYDVVVLDPDRESPAGGLATRHLCADYSDPAALDELARGCAAVTTEFENVPAETLRALATHCRVAPSADAVTILQDRIREKTFLRDNGFPTARFAVIEQADDLADGLDAIGGPALFKTSRLGYDGKGQARVQTVEEARAAYARLGGVHGVLEELLPLQAEVSVVLARSADGAVEEYPLAENQHANGILDLTIVPARVAPKVKQRAFDMAREIADRLDYCGVLAVECFVLPGDELAVNELAPRPHNSGHFTLDACVTSQFEQQVRAMCGLPLGSPRLVTPAVMVNLLGDLWGASAPDWRRLLEHPNVKLHLYGKRTARPGRKMGHFTCLDADLDAALELAQGLKHQLRG